MKYSSPLETDDMETEPWDWIPHADGADRQKEINTYLKDMLDRMPLAASIDTAKP